MARCKPKIVVSVAGAVGLFSMRLTFMCAC